MAACQELRELISTGQRFASLLLPSFVRRLFCCGRFWCCVLGSKCHLSSPSNPAVLIAATLCGFRIGLLVTVLSALLTVYWIFPPIGQFVILSTSQTISLAVFIGMGVFMSAVAGRYRQTERWRADQALRASNQ